MRKRIFLSDFDGTLVCRDILDVICGIVGKEEESRTLNEGFIAGQREGLPTLKQRIDFLRGVTVPQIETLLNKEPYLIDGAHELFDYLGEKKFITVLHSGNILPVLEYYKKLLNIDFIVGTNPRMEGETIMGIELTDFRGRRFKVDGCEEIIRAHNIAKEDIFAIGDSPSDRDVFGLASKRIVINPKGGIEAEAQLIVKGSLTEVIEFLECS